MKARVTIFGLIVLLICLLVCMGSTQWWRNAADLQGATSLIVLKAKTSQDFVPDAPFVGEVNGSYIDPEFNEVTSQVVFQDNENRVWIGDIDPVTGFFKTATGRDYLVDENITIIFDRPPQGRKFSTNGPEWTWDANGQPCVVYTKADENGIMQQWMAKLVNGKPVVTQITHNPFDCYGNMPSRFVDGKPPRIAYTFGWPIWKAKAAWIFADRPDEPHYLDGFDYTRMSMWSAVSPDFLFIQRKKGMPYGQVARVNSHTGEVTVLTDDEGEKDDPNFFVAPEFGGEILLVCNVDNRALGIYRDEKRDGKSPWKRIATLTLPEDAPYKFISSVEVIAPATGIGGVSYFTLLARKSKDRNSPGSIWVLGLGNRLARRVDDGAVTGEEAILLEPEPFVGKNEVFVYYNYYGRGRHGLRRARTGIKVPENHVRGKPLDRKYVVLICIDGCRPDYFSFANIPNIKKLMAEGVTYDQAWVGHLRNDTPPGHATLVTGAFPARHGLIGFHWQDPATGQLFKPTTWFGVARGQLNDFIAKSGCESIGSAFKKVFPGAKVAALSSNKFYAAASFGADSADFIGYCRYEPRRGFGTSVGHMLVPETVKGREVPAEIMNDPALKRKVTNLWDGDSWTIDFALRLFEREKPEVLLINLALCDDIGHMYGANLGKEQIAQIISNVDRQIGRLIDAYKRAGIYENTFFVITSDHGMSANLHTIDETPMAPIVSEYGLKRSAARLEFYVNNPAKAKEAAEKIASLKLDGIHAVYYKVRDGKGGYQYLPASGSKVDSALDACYRYLTFTYASPQSPDLVCFPAENWNIKEATEYFKGDHGTATWENQHIPLIIVGPGIKKGVISHAPARLVDVAPTILAAMGLKSEKMDGVVLADALVSAPEELVRAQEAVNAQLTPLRDALKRRHDQDLMRAASTRSSEGARDDGQVSQMGQIGRWLQYFKQLDRNNDGKVTREEAGGARWFDWLDRNKDGAITPDEIGQQTPLKPPTSSTAGRVKVGRKVIFEFTRDYTPGTRDSKGQMRTGQELMRIIAYRGQLFASTSTFTDPRIYTNDPDYTGCQVLRKSSSKSEWEVDVSFGRRYLRTDCLEVVRFTRDANGRPLPQPVEMLVAGLWDIGEIGWLPPGSEDVLVRMQVYRDVAKQIFGRDFRGAGLMVAGLNRYITVAIRDDATGKWIISRVARVPDSERGFASVRAMKVHRDKVTGREYLFVGASYGVLYKGVYDPSVPGKIRWLDDPELDASFGRIHSMCVCNGSLYVSTDYGGLTVQNQRGGIFRRIDGVKPKWERVYFNYDPRYPTWNQTARGITAVPAEDGSGKEVILAAVEWPPEPIIVRIEPHRGHRAVVELNYYDYFTAVFSRPPKILGGSKENPHAGCLCAALNYFEPFINPETGKIERFVTLFLVHPDDPAEGANGAYFLIRRAPGVYDWGEIPSGLPAGQHLRGTRTVEKSPFPDEPNTYYFGGFFAGPDEQPPRPNTAWIYKGKYKGTVEVGKP